MHTTPTATTNPATTIPAGTTTGATRHRRARRRGLTALVALGVLLGAGACSSAADGATPGSDVAIVADGSAPATTIEPATAPADGAVVTPVVGDTVNARLAKALPAKAEPSADSPTVTTLPARTELGSTTTVLVVGEQEDWIEVLLPIRPNGATGWLRKADVELRDNDVAVTVDLAARRVTVTKAGEVVVDTEAAIGAGDTPTPTGTFSVTDLVETDGPGNAYGPYAIGLSGHSETLSEFGGGDGQIGLHGTNDPSSIGQAVSHGCVRVPNDVVTQLVQLVPLGTPVTIV